MILYALNAGGGRFDPAFDAHVLPIQAWAFAWWQHWQPVQALQEALAQAIMKLAETKGSVWQRVTGPVSALVAKVVLLPSFASQLCFPALPPSFAPQ